MRLDTATAAIMDALADKLGLNRSAVVRLAVRRLAETDGIEIPRSEGKAAA
ncbi:MAG TPA: ribbon-helix-helix protein, CopG family [Chloroflexota bacterium]|jgi:antitoxin component of RelBE/YafQ-DinJ toxin-antitoxin module